MYPRMFGGHMWIAMDPPTQEQTTADRHLYIRNFVVRGEPRSSARCRGRPGQRTRSRIHRNAHGLHARPGQMAVRDGVVRGPLVGATIEGIIDYLRDEVHLRGTFVPLYGVNNIFGRVPFLGTFLGGGRRRPARHRL